MKDWAGVLQGGNEFARGGIADAVATELERAIGRHLQKLVATGAAVETSDSIASAGQLLPEQQRAIETLRGELVAEAVSLIGGFAAETERRCQALLGGGTHQQPKTPFRSLPGWAGAEIRGLDPVSAPIEEWAGPVVGQTYLETYFRIPRSTLHCWQRQGDVVALLKGRRKHVFPLAQFVDHRPVPALRQILHQIKSPRLAWFWLTRPCSELDGRLPIEMLRQDRSHDVVHAATLFASNL